MRSTTQCKHSVIPRQRNLQTINAAAQQVPTAGVCRRWLASIGRGWMTGKLPRPRSARRRSRTRRTLCRASRTRSRRLGKVRGDGRVHGQVYKPAHRRQNGQQQATVSKSAESTTAKHTKHTHLTIYSCRYTMDAPFVVASPVPSEGPQVPMDEETGGGTGILPGCIIA